MSLIVEIQGLSPENTGDGLSSVLRDLVKSLGSTMGSATFDIFEKTICRGILQNNVDISFTNKWDSTVYQGVMSGITKLTQTADTGTWGNWGKAIMAAIDFTNTGLNMGGMSMIGTGAASTKMYGGSSITGLTISLKWYTPQSIKATDNTGTTINSPEYVEAIKALMVLGFPSQRNLGDKNKTQGSIGVNGIDSTSNNGNNEEKGKIKKTLETLFSINPPPVVLRILSGSRVIYNLHPLVITNIGLTSSRETMNGIPVVIGANISFDFYQIKGNGGYDVEGKKLTFAGIDLLDKVVSSEKEFVPTMVTDTKTGVVSNTWAGQNLAKDKVYTQEKQPNGDKIIKGYKIPEGDNANNAINNKNLEVTYTVKTLDNANGTVEYSQKYFDIYGNTSTGNPVTETHIESTDRDGARLVTTNKQIKNLNGDFVSDVSEKYTRKSDDNYEKIIITKDSRGVSSAPVKSDVSATDVPDVPKIPTPTTSTGK